MTRLQLNLDPAARAKAEQARKERIAALDREERGRIMAYFVLFLAGVAVGTFFALAFLL